MAKILWRGAVALVLTALSFVGGLAYLFALLFRRRVLAFLLFYCVFSALLLGAQWLAMDKGENSRIPRSSVSFMTHSILRPASPLYPILHRDWASPELRNIAMDLGRHMQTQFPGTITTTLDAGFPFSSLPLLPHLSHDDGEKLDLSLWWQDETGKYLPGKSKSPIGYWGYASGPTNCPQTWKDLRWDMAWLQSILPNYTLDKPRTRAALVWLANDPRVSKILVEPHILATLKLSHPKLKFQGCRAARHDDHIHIQL